MIRRVFADLYYFRLMFYAVFAVSCLAAILAAANAASGGVDAAWISYFGPLVIDYWVIRIPSLVILLFLAWIVYFWDPAKVLHGVLVRRKLVARSARSEHRQTARRAVLFFIPVIIFIIVVGFPVAHLSDKDILFFWSVIIPIPLLFLGYISTFSNALVGQAAIKSIARLEYRLRSFCIAEMSVESTEAVEAIRRYDDLARQYGKRGPEVLAYLKHGEGHSDGFEGVSNLPHRVAGLLSIESLDRLSFHDRTMSALKVAFEDIQASMKKHKRRVIVAMCDLEYPETIRQAQAVFGKKYVQILEMGQHVAMSAPMSSRVELLTRHVIESNADVCIVSHVDFSTGAITPLAELVNNIKNAMQQAGTVKNNTAGDVRHPIIVCDGAQAFGQIEISSEDMMATDYYATCCHKWVLGRESLGILVARRETTKVRESGRALAVASDFEELDRPNNEAVSGTIDMRPYISSAVSLYEIDNIGIASIQQHNRELVQIFIDAVARTRTGIVLLRTGELSGMAMYVPRGVSAEEVNQQLDAEYRGTIRRVGYNRDTAPVRSGIRFCFHFYHSESDVLMLVDELEAAVFAVRRSADPQKI